MFKFPAENNQEVDFAIYGITGKVIKRVYGVKEKQFLWSTSVLANGTYVIRARIGGKKIHSKFLFVR